MSDRIFHSITAFIGLHRREFVPEGGFAALERVSTEAYPLLKSMDGEAALDLEDTPLAMTVRHVEHGGVLKEHFIALTQNSIYLAPAGAGAAGGTWQELDTPLSDSPKQLANMGKKLVIFPDAVYLDMEEPTKVVSLNARYSTRSSFDIAPCDRYGNPISLPSATAPANPTGGSRYADTTDIGTTVYEWSAVTLQWVAVEPYVRIKRSGIGKGFHPGDVVEISGLTHSAEYTINAGALVTGDAFYTQLEALNGTHELIACGENWIVFTGLLLAVARRPSAGGADLAVSRTAPEMDFVCECNNRLWGCKYGMVDGELINELYASTLGDPTNWHRYAGLADDSWAASVGTDGPWTGCVNYNGAPYFFRENAVYKIYISAAGAHQVVESIEPGVGMGCAKSLAVLNGQLYYARRDGVYRFDGGIPQRISTNLGSMTIGRAVAGTDGHSYYLCIQEPSPAEVLVYHTESGGWGRAGGGSRESYAYFDHTLYSYADGVLYYPDPNRYRTSPEDAGWYAESGWFYPGMNSGKTSQKPLRQAITEVRVLANLKDGAPLTLSLERDMDNSFEPVRTFTRSDSNPAGHLAVYRFPMPPERCEVFRYRLSGEGPCTVYRVMFAETESDG